MIAAGVSHARRHEGHCAALGVTRSGL